jgi:hypothetical protein
VQSLIQLLPGSLARLIVTKVYQGDRRDTTMGIDAFLETESGAALGKVSDPHNLLTGAILAGGHDSTVCLRFLDPWGDATFNHMQIPILVVELRALRDRVDAATREQLEAIVLLAARATEQPHLYLKFCGD